ncbi:LysR family transcriptional regulator [Gayadomonas joobiniege]|uniref:LysR family transcriptional regulator n=1 Tax=Gayadomonas joobiniege TaxID=1234606 RepID=UPI0003752F1D|nr:LysR family transcriptional regulator [Gayadomonas joobiniege]
MNARLLKSLRVFIEVADTQSMSVAAKKLHMTVSAISQQLKKLEDETQIRLFHRDTRSLNLTSAGQVYYTYAKQMMLVSQEALTKLEQLQQQPSGDLSIIAPEGFGGGLLSRPVDSLIQNYPKLKLDLTLTDQPLDLQKTPADLAISLHEVNQTGYVSRHLATWRRVLCVAKSHPLAQKRLSTPEDLTSYVHVAHQSSLFLKYRHSGQPQEIAVASANICVNSMQTCIQLALDGLGYAILPEPEIRHYLLAGDMVHILPDWLLDSYHVYAVTPDDDTMPAKTGAAVDHIKDWFSQI